MEQQLRDRGLNGRALLIDGSFWPKKTKACGCCGPPPSADYKVEFLSEDDQRLKGGKFVRVEVGGGRLVAHVDAQLYEAAEVAGQDFVVSYEEATDGTWRAYAQVL